MFANSHQQGIPMPYKYEEGHNYPWLNELFHEFASFIGGLQTMYIESIIGYSLIHRHVVNHQNSIKELLGECEVSEQEFQNECSITYKSICGVDINPALLSPVMKQGDILSRNSPGGQNEITIGQQCIVSAYSYWEDYLRLEIAKAKGMVAEKGSLTKQVKEVLANHLSFDLWGDIRYLRNSIVHNKGIATKKCGEETKIFKWFNEGESINLSYNIMRKIFLEIAKFRNQIHSWSLPKHYISIHNSRQR